MKARYSIKRICLVWLLVFACALLVFTCADAAYAIHLNERTTGGFITSNRITAAAAGGEYVFIGTTEGLFLYPPAGGEKIHLTADDGLVSSHITSLYFSSGCGILAIGTNNGVSLFSSVDEPILSCTVSDGLASNDIRAVYIDDTEGRLYVSLFGGWVSTGRLEGLSKPSFETYQTGGGHATMVSSVGVSNYCRDPGGRLWHGTNGSGVHILHPSGEWESFADIMRGLWVTGLASPGGGHMYIGTTDGLFRCPVDNIQDITSVEPFSDLWIKGLGVRKGHLLAGSVEGLFSLLHDKRVDVNSVYCLNTRRLNTVESSAEIFMIGTEDDGVYVYDYPFPRIPLASGPNGESWLREEERSYDRKTVICCYSNEEDVAALVSLAETIGLALLQRDETLKALLFSAGKNMDVEQHMADLLRKVEDSGTVKGRVTVHKNRYMSPAYQSSDPLYTVQHSYLEQTGVEELWERWEHSQPEGEVTGRGVTVAVVDTGVSSQHIDLDGQVTAGENFNVPSNGSAEDDNSHGTFCAGIIACLADNSEGIRGLAPGVSILPVKCLSAMGFGTSWSVAQGILYASEHDARVISLSLGTTYYCPLVHHAVAVAYARNCVIVAASGNDGTKASNFPSALHEVLSVGSVNSQGERSSFSSHGPQVDVSAPGEDIISAVCGDYYAMSSGTSCACPHVSALAAIILSVDSSLSNDQVASIIAASAGRSSGEDDKRLDWEPELGYGVINFSAALELVETRDFSLSLHQEKMKRVKLPQEEK